jgi:hypothetical protein
MPMLAVAFSVVQTSLIAKAWRIFANSSLPLQQQVCRCCASV